MSILESVLVVEDKQEWIEILSDLLTDSHVDCDTSCNLEDAILRLEKHRYTVLVADLDLKGNDQDDTWDGWKLLQKAKDSRISWIIVSGAARTHHFNQANRDYGPGRFYEKSTFYNHQDSFLDDIRKAHNDTLDRQRKFSLRDDSSPTQRTSPECYIEVDVGLAGDTPVVTVVSHFFGDRYSEQFIPPIDHELIDGFLRLVAADDDKLFRSERRRLLKSFNIDISESRENFLKEFGRSLYNSITPGDVGVSIATDFEFLRRDDLCSSIDIRLVIDERLADFACLPWELLEDGRRFLVNGVDMGLTRNIRLRRVLEGNRRLAITAPISVLVVAPRPVNAGRLPAPEAREITDSLRNQELGEHFRFEFLEGPQTLENMRATLYDARHKGKSYDILFFDGHGTVGWQCPSCKQINIPFSRTCQRSIVGNTKCGRKRPNRATNGFVLFEDGTSGSLVPVGAEEMASLLRDERVNLAILSACNTAEIPETSMFGSVATAMVKERVPVVIGMQFRVSTNDTLAFFGRFFVTLGHCFTKTRCIGLVEIETAVREARSVLLPTRRHCPVLYSRTRNPRL